MFTWLLKGAGLNKTTWVCFAAILGGLGLVFNGNWQEGMLLVVPAIQQLFIRWSTSSGTSWFFQRTFWASLGGICTGGYMASQGNLAEGIPLIMASITALTQRQNNAKVDAK